jgi:hypothetical protein
VKSTVWGTRTLTISLLIALVFVSGCILDFGKNKLDFVNSDETQEPQTLVTPSTPITILTTVPVPSTSTPVSLKDPIVGYWYCMVYPSWGGKVLNEFTLMENQTWNRVITEYQAKVEKEYAHGTWRKERADRYLLTSSITHVSHTFAYDKAKDELLDVDFNLLYHRVV